MRACPLVLGRLLIRMMQAMQAIQASNEAVAAQGDGEGAPAAAQCQCPECGCVFTNPVPKKKGGGKGAKRQ